MKYFENGTMPYATSARACSFVSARCIGPTSRHFDRSAVLPCCAATSFHVCQCVPIASKPCFVVAAIDSRPVPYLPAALAPVGEIDAATATSRFGSLYGFSCRRASCSVNQSVCLVTVSPRSSAMIASSASSMRGRCVVGGDAEHVRVGGELARAAAEHRATAGEVVEQHEAIGEHQRVVVGERVHAAAEPDVLRARGRGRDEHLGRRDDLVAARVVLADPHLVEAEAVEVLDQVEVAFERERRVLPGRVERGHEESEAHAAIRPAT